MHVAQATLPSKCPWNMTVPPLWAFLLAVPLAWNIPSKFIRPTSLLLPGLCPSAHFMKEKSSWANLSALLPVLVLSMGKIDPTLNLLGWPGPSLDYTER